MNASEIEIAPADGFENFQDLAGRPRRIEYIAVSIFVFVTALVTASTVLTRIGSVYINSIATSVMVR